MKHHVAINANAAKVERATYLGLSALRVEVDDIDKFADTIALLCPTRIEARINQRRVPVWDTPAPSAPAPTKKRRKKKARR